VRALRLETAKQGSKARQEYELAARELAAKYEKKMKMLRDDLELRRKHELHEVGWVVWGWGGVWGSGGLGGVGWGLG